ncbi:peptidase M10A and M12B matrixin and adamalysin [Fodinicola acaciae]|uniref:peptidase M10A and M12B matrixin and adamalysin n=1 Tax=Fodinicola acaciae TaxID=2681555 RepID=UPI0013CF7B65|nr:peptidase M10A and M12B matrixin and adamalysin [Fodinicola acaciae]
MTLRTASRLAVVLGALLLVLIVVAPWPGQTGAVPDDAQSVPLGHPVARPVASGPYAFTLTQGSDSRPVAYDPCRPVHFVVNNSRKPAAATASLTAALTRLQAATGLVFRYDGPTTETPVAHRPAYQPGRYGSRWAPVLISWSDPAHTAALDGTVIGTGYSDAYGSPGARRYVTGVVVLDGPQISRLLGTSGGRSRVRAIIEHELGHLVGLAHVHDPHEIMNPDATITATDYGPGDLRGLALLGSGPCYQDT